MLADLHLHTCRSFDSRLDPARVIAVAKRRGLDAIAVTDHDTIDGALETRQLAAGGLLVVVGEEITTSSGDVIGLFLRETIVTTDAMEAIDAIHAQGGVAILPHPFLKSLGIEEKVARALDGVEGYNARYSPPPRDAENVGDRRTVEFAQAYDLTLTASSDAHRYRDIGRGRTVVPASNLDELKDALLKGRTTLGAMPRTALQAAWDRALDAAASVIDPVPERMLYPKETR